MNEIPLEKMEKLEDKYNINLHIDQYCDTNKAEYFVINGNNKTYIGSTIEEVEKNLIARYKI